MKRVLKENGSGESANHIARSGSAQNSVAPRFNDSPHMIAQRQKLQSLFGGAAQLQEAEDEMLQGKFKVVEARHVEQQAQGRVKPTLQAKGVPVNDDVGLEQEADVMGERAWQHVGKGALETKPFSSYLPIQKSRSVAQMKAGVESFTAKWSDHDRGNTGAGFRIDYAAKFRDGGGFSAADAEFRQHAADKWKKVKQTGVTTEGATNMVDDRYSRANDASDYKGQDFKSDDLPGFQAGQLGATDNITWEFWADQYIVDTSNKNEVIACIPTQYAKITGADPRDFSKPADKEATIKR